MAHENQTFSMWKTACSDRHKQISAYEENYGILHEFFPFCGFCRCQEDYGHLFNNLGLLFYCRFTPTFIDMYFSKQSGSSIILTTSSLTKTDPNEPKHVFGNATVEIKWLLEMHHGNTMFFGHLSYKYHAICIW